MRVTYVVTALRNHHACVTGPDNTDNYLINPSSLLSRDLLKNVAATALGNPQPTAQ